MQLSANMQNNIAVPVRPHSIVDCLQKLALNKPEATAYIFLENGEAEIDGISYRELNEKAKRIASYLQCYREERALLTYPPGLDFIVAFFGCLLAGVIAVPAYLPRHSRKISRLVSILKDSGAKIALTTESWVPHSKSDWLENEAIARLKWIATDRISLPTKATHCSPSIAPEDLAFLQYTSGSTGNPKGVMISHGNLMDNEEAIAQAFCHNENTIFVGWLPLFHDMGLIGNVLQPIYLGIPSILMSPLAFIQKPVRWLQAISKYRATTSGGPNFAYDLCVEKVKPEQFEKLDLSSWEVAFNGAETVRSQTLEQFFKKFAPCGFRSRAFYPCYGMAETTLFATGGLKTKEPITREFKELESNSLVGCGKSWRDHQIVIVDPQTKTCCNSGEIGEIWISGNSVAKGYWNQTQLSRETFFATCREMGEKQFLRTGDLGFLVEEELFVTGRLKEVIIIRGQNHYPQDIEYTVQQSHPALRLNGGAVFAVEVGMNGQTKLVIVQEVEQRFLKELDTKEVTKRIVSSVTEQHGLPIHKTVLIKSGSLPKTSSGKIQRHICRQQFLNNELKTIEK